MESNTMQSNAEPKLPETSNNEPEGLGGWLILVQISIYLSLILVVVTFTQSILPILTSDVMDVFTDESSPVYEPLVQPLIWFETAGSIVQLLFLVLIIVLLYSKKRAFPKVMIAFMVVSFIFLAIDYAFVLQISLLSERDKAESAQEAGRTLISCAIWIPYLLRSERVRNTFVR